MSINPKMTVICPSYNHEKYISQMIESVFKQTEQNFELIIIDDNSSDNTVAEAIKHNDNRIIVKHHDYNLGINQSLNEGVSLAKGDYITILASDDMFDPLHFETSIKYLDAHKDVDVFYSWLLPIDENGNMHNYDKNKKPFSGNRNEALRRLYYYGNVFPSPGMVVRREAFLKILPLPLSLANCQDYIMHVRLLVNGDFYQSKNPLVYYRRHSKNLSVSGQISNIRTRYELSHVLNAFKAMNSEQIKDVFSKELKELQLPVEKRIKLFVLGMLGLKHYYEHCRLWAYTLIMEFCESKENVDYLHKMIGFDYGKLLSLSKVLHDEFHFPKRSWLERFFQRRCLHYEKKRRLKRCQEEQLS